jgi:thiamine-monophosphate kinase
VAVSEASVITSIVAATAVRPGTAIGIDDDAAVLEPCGSVVLTHDVLAEGVHFRLPTSHRDLGWKALAVNVSDIAAMGAEPVAALVGLCLPGPDVLDIEAFYGGMEELAAETGTTVAGGDLSAGGGVVIGVTVAGRLRDDEAPLLRSGARPGDALLVTGSLGASEAGRTLLEQPDRAVGLDPGARDALLRAHHRPRPELGAARVLRDLGARALMDCSDGAVIDVGRMAVASGCGATIALDAVPRAGGVDAVARHVGMEPDLFAATAGEDYRLLAAIAPDRARRALAELPGSAVIGGFTAGSGVRTERSGAAIEVARPGYTHHV